TAFQARLREVQEMLQRAVTPELEQRLRELQEALAKLDPEAARQALQRLAEAQQQLKAELERSRELFRRAATEGALASPAGDAAGAQQAGEEAEQQLAELPDALRARRDSLAGAWRQETLDALDRALAETAALAEREQQVAESLRRGDGSPTTRSRQASVEEGTAAVERQIREAAGKHALVSPQLEGALG